MVARQKRVLERPRIYNKTFYKTYSSSRQSYAFLVEIMYTVLFIYRIGVWTQILPGLYIGNLRAASNKRILDENKISHVLSIHDAAKDLMQVCESV